MACCAEGFRRKKEWLESLEDDDYLPEIEPHEESCGFRICASSLLQGTFLLRVSITILFVGAWLVVASKTDMLRKIQKYVFWVLGIGLSLLLSFKLRVALKRYWEARTAMADCLAEIRSTTATLLAAYETDPARNSETWELVDDTLSKIEGFFWSCVYCLKDRDLQTVPNKWVVTQEMKDRLAECKPNQWPLLYILLLKANLTQLRRRGVVTPPIYSSLYKDHDKMLFQYYKALKVATTPFPYPYNQLMVGLSHGFCYMVSLIITVSFGVSSIFYSTVVSFIFLGLDHIAGELMDPFGDDVVDLAIIRLADGLKHDMLNFRKCMSVVSDDLPASIPLPEEDEAKEKAGKDKTE